MLEVCGQLKNAAQLLQGKNCLQVHLGHVLPTNSEPTIEKIKQKAPLLERIDRQQNFLNYLIEYLQCTGSLIGASRILEEAVRNEKRCQNMMMGASGTVTVLGALGIGAFKYVTGVNIATSAFNAIALCLASGPTLAAAAPILGGAAVSVFFLTTFYQFSKSLLRSRGRKAQQDPLHEGKLLRSCPLFSCPKKMLTSVDSCSNGSLKRSGSGHTLRYCRSFRRDGP